jgi:predicted dinucleotide-binding enzyme
MRCSVIGAGATGRAVPRRLALAGGTVLPTDQDTAKARRSAAADRADAAPGFVLPAGPPAALGGVDLAVPALPHRECPAPAADHPPAGTVVVDVANPPEEPEERDATKSGTTSSADPSAAGRRAAAASDSIVVKAFDTAFAPIPHAGASDGIRVGVPAASGHDARPAVVEPANRSGLEGSGMGRLHNARGLESLAALSHELRDRLGRTVRAGFTFLPHW